jgi:hypothetical protein
VARSDPSTTKLKRFEENIGAADVQLTPDDLREIESSAAKITVQGEPVSGTSETNGRSLSMAQGRRRSVYELTFSVRD